MLATLAQSGGQQWHNYIQIIVIVLAISASAIGALLKKLAEQRALRQQKLARERQRETMLRTGRVDEQRGAAAPDAQAQAAPPPLPNIVPEDEARRRLQELAQRRRAELAELARREHAAAAPSAPPQPMPPAARPQSAHRPHHPPPPPPRPAVLTPQSEQNLRRARAQADKERAARDKAARKAAAQAERQREQERRQRAASRATADAAVPPDHERGIEQTEISGSPSRIGAPSRAGSARAGTPTTPEEWRRALITAELLKPPLALREE